MVLWVDLLGLGGQQNGWMDLDGIDRWIVAMGIIDC